MPHHSHCTGNAADKQQYSIDYFGVTLSLFLVLESLMVAGTWKLGKQAGASGDLSGLGSAAAGSGGEGGSADGGSLGDSLLDA